MINYPGPKIVLTVQILRDHVGELIAAKLDKVGFDWQHWIDNIPTFFEEIANAGTR